MQVLLGVVLLVAASLFGFLFTKGLFGLGFVPPVAVVGCAAVLFAMVGCAQFVDAYQRRPGRRYHR